MATKKSILRCTSLFRELLTYMMEDARNITYCLHLMFCAKNIERMGDHATNIAETVYYIMEGKAIVEQRPKGDTTSFARWLPTKANRETRDNEMPRILIVEDEAALSPDAPLQSGSGALHRRHRFARRRGRDQAAENPPDLVILDWMLPGLSGIEICRRLACPPETRALPIIILTARGEESERIRACPPAQTITLSSLFPSRSLSRA